MLIRLGEVFLIWKYVINFGSAVIVRDAVREGGAAADKRWRGNIGKDGQAGHTKPFVSKIYAIYANIEGGEGIRRTLQYQ